MTTNHRPTLESKKGKNITIRDSIVHARSFPQLQNLKVRSDIPPQTLDKAVKELRDGNKTSGDGCTTRDSSANVDDISDGDECDAYLRAYTVGLENPINSKKRIREKNDDIEESSKVESSAKESFTIDEPELKKSRVDTKSVIVSEAHDESSDDDDDDDDDDDEEDTDALIAEINKIRQDKTMQSLTPVSSTQATDLDRLLYHQEPTSKKSGWRRLAKKFNERKHDLKSNFTTDSQNSQFHQDFLSKYIK